MSAAISHSVLLTSRGLRGLRRMPVFLGINLIQPVIWLLLFGQLFKAVVRIPGFAAGGSFLEFLTPGVIMMTALFASVWAGTTYIQDMERGVMDRMLTSPVSRGAVMTSTLAYQSIVSTIQTLVVIGIALLAGARFPGRVAGVLVTIVAAVLLTIAFAAISNAVALIVRQQQALIGISQLLTLPLLFSSSATMDTGLAPSWVRAVSRYNPMEWAVSASRSALSATPDRSAIAFHLGLLAVLAAILGLVATRAFRSYQRSA
jgi:ABC-2 type transport system permease protein